MRFKILIVMSMAMVLAACSSTPPSPFDLKGTQWTLTSVVENGVTETPPAGASITLDLGRDGKASGHSGCNTYSGAFETQGEIIKFGALTTTLMACVDPNVMEFEGMYLSRLYSAQIFERLDNQLTLTFGDGKGRLVFRAR
jgi:heat shock protein HslJ